jgi:hypothetical protein
MEPLNTPFDTAAREARARLGESRAAGRFQMNPTAPSPASIGGESNSTLEVRDLLSVHEALTDRIRQRRLCLRSALQVLGGSLADALAEAPSATVQVFFDANEQGLDSLQTLRTLARELQVSSFVVRTGVSAEISHGLRLHLRLQARRLDALVRTLSSVESQLESFTHRAAHVAQR